MQADEAVALMLCATSSTLKVVYSYDIKSVKAEKINDTVKSTLTVADTVYTAVTGEDRIIVNGTIIPFEKGIAEVKLDDE